MQAQDPLIGNPLGKYKILTEIGRGGMGAVYKGYDPALDRYVAIKVLAPHLVWEQAFVERFLREARAAARLKHSSIVTIHDVGQEGNWYYFVMEYLEGQSLNQIIEQYGALPVRNVLAIVAVLASALDYAHKQGLVHRDIKPGNIIISPAGEVAITDFGIARAVRDKRMTSTGTVLGTPEYMAPEQAQGLDVGASSDLYSLAVVTYQMLNGQVPYQADSTLALLYKIVNEPLPSIRQTHPDFPRGVENVFARALAKDPNQRYATAQDFVTTLKRAFSGGKIEPLPVPPRPKPTSQPNTPTVIMESGEMQPASKDQSSSQATPPPPGPHRPRWMWALIGIAVLAFIGIGATVLGRTGISPTPEPTATVTLSPTQTQRAEVTKESGSVLVDPPKPTSTAIPISPPPPTQTSQPIKTPTRAPTQTRTPTRTPTQTRAPTRTPIPQPTFTATSVPARPPVPVAPPGGSQTKSPVLFQWSGFLGAGQTYQVTAYHTESNFALQSEQLSNSSWTVDLPGDKFGEWHWRVAVIASGKVVATSDEWLFWFNPGFSGGGSGGGGGTQATATPAPP